MNSRLVKLIIICLILLPAKVWAGERLAYAVSYKGSDYSVARTDIYGIDPETDRSSLLFSDEKLPIILIERLYVFHFPAIGDGKLFAHAAERGKTIPFPGNAAIYELSTDGSNGFRKICSVQGVEFLGDIFVNSKGTRLGYINRVNKKQYIFIHDAASGELLNQIDITDQFLDCYASSIGWVPKKDNLYFSLETGDEHITSPESYARVGTYLMDEKGQNLNKLLKIPNLKGFSKQESTRLIGILPGGGYVYETMHFRKSKKSFLVILKVKKDFSSAEDIGFSRDSGLYTGIRVSYQISASGKYLSAAALPISSSATSSSVFLKNLDTGKERILLSLPTEGLQGPFLGLVGWLD